VNARSSLPPLDVSSRAGRVRARLDDSAARALLVTNLTNVRWLTGFTGSAGRVLVLPDELVLVTDGRYGERAEAELDAARAQARVVVARTQATQLDAIASTLDGLDAVGLEATDVRWADLDRYREALPLALVATTGLVESERRTKDAAELARIERACAIASEALADVFDLVDVEPTERDFALALDDRMRALGAEGPSFPSIVASGPNAAKPHHDPSDRRMREGDCLILDFGALCEGYHSDMTRTALLGQVDPWLLAAFTAVEEAQAAGVQAVAAGLSGVELDQVCRDHLTVAGYGDYFTHGTGHGVGLLIQEIPWAVETSVDTLSTGDVVTVEPGVYRSSLGGIRIEDTVVVTDGGCRPLTHTPKDLSCLRSPRTT
jgi:Xaa-Pro aminopeptidase